MSKYIGMFKSFGSSRLTTFNFISLELEIRKIEVLFIGEKEVKSVIYKTKIKYTFTEIDGEPFLR
jgi:hypothetical protein